MAELSPQWGAQPTDGEVTVAELQAAGQIGSIARRQRGECWNSPLLLLVVSPRLKSKDG